MSLLRVPSARRTAARLSIQPMRLIVITPTVRRPPPKVRPRRLRKSPGRLAGAALAPGQPGGADG